MILKLGILQDDKFYDRVKDCLIWKNSNDEWTSLDEYLERNPEKKVYYHHDEKQQSHFFDMYKEKGIEILFAPSHLDTPLMSFLEGKHSGVTFQRLDGALDEAILDKDKEKTVLDQEGKTEASKLADYIRSKLPEENLEVEAKSLSSSAVPSFMMLSEKERRMRDYFALSGQDLPPSMGAKKTFVVNTNSPLVQSIQKLENQDEALATSLVKQLYELSLLSQRELDANDFSSFLKRSTELLEKLTTAAVKAK